MNIRRLLTLLVVSAAVLVLIPSATAMPIDSKHDVQPPARGYSRLIYDPTSETVYLFGGSTQFGLWDLDLFDVWAFNLHNKQWRLVWQSSDYYPPFNYDSLAFDAQSGKVILFQPFAPGPFPDYSEIQTWAYDLATNTWQNMQPATAPSMRWGSRMTYDTESDRVILFGGSDANTSETLNDTWAYDYDSNTWVDLQPTGDISPYHFFDMVYDPAIDRILLFGGTRLVDGVWTTQNDTWAFDYNTNTWTDRQPAVSPSPRAYHSMAYDAKTDQIISFGGILSDEAWPNEPTLGETWAYSYAANTWRQITPKEAPAARAWQTMIGTKNETILFGGGPSRWTYTAETWSFNARSEKWKLIK